MFKISVIVPVYNEEIPIQWDIIPDNIEEADSLKSE